MLIFMIQKHVFILLCLSGYYITAHKCPVFPTNVLVLDEHRLFRKCIRPSILALHQDPKGYSKEIQGSSSQCIINIHVWAILRDIQRTSMGPPHSVS